VRHSLREYPQTSAFGPAGNGGARKDVAPVYHAESCGTGKEWIMADDLKTAANWAKELGVPEKKLKDALKAAGIEPDAKKGVCAYYSKASAEKANKAVK
jgi:hypothetical protein